MKLFLLLLHFMALPHLVQASRLVKDTIPPAGVELLKELELTDEQKAIIKELLVEYKLKEKRQKRQLRQQIFAVLTTRQRRRLKRIWQYKHPLRR
jgi:DNA-binding MarR family transcriptional regulator